MKSLVVLLFLWAAALNAGAQSHPCSEIEDPGERLACFDAQFPEDPDEPVALEAPDPDPTGDEAEAAPLEPAPAAVTAAPAGQPSVTSAPEPSAESTWLGDEKVTLSSTIRAIRAGEKQKMVFLLDNEQIWMQSSPRILPFEAGDRITIKNALLGGYYMHSEKGTSTRVQRIQ